MTSDFFNLQIIIIHNKLARFEDQPIFKVFEKSFV